MTQTEENAKWIKSERKKLARLIGSISTIVAEQALLNRYKQKYELSLETAMVGGIQLRVYKIGENEPIEDKQLWNIDSYFEHGSFYFNKEAMRKSIEEATEKVNEIKQLANKYAKINFK